MLFELAIVLPAEAFAEKCKAANVARVSRPFARSFFVSGKVVESGESRAAVVAMMMFVVLLIVVVVNLMLVVIVLGWAVL